MPLKTWAPYDRLDAVDLNGAMRYASGSGLLLPGAQSVTPGASITPAANTAAVEAKCGAPAAGQDPLGYFQSGTGRLRIPAGLAGLYLVTATFEGLGPDNAAGQYGQGLINGAQGVGTSETFAIWSRGTTGVTPYGTSGVIVRPLVDGQELFMSMRALLSNGVAFRVAAWALVRLGNGVGAIGG